MAYAPFTREEYIDNDYIDSNYCATITGNKVESFSIAEKHIHLAEGVTTYHPTDDLYREMRFFRRMDESLRVVYPWCEAQGNIYKGTDDSGDHYTARLTQFKDGWLISPHNNDGIDYILNVTGEQISDIGTSGSLLMYTDDMEGKILVNYTPPDTEIIKVEVGVLSPSDAEDIATAVWEDYNGANVALTSREVRTVLGLTPNDPITVGNGAYTSGTVNIDVTDNGDGTYTLDRVV